LDCLIAHDAFVKCTYLKFPADSEEPGNHPHHLCRNFHEIEVVLPDLEPEVVPSYKDEPSRRRRRKEFAARHIQMMAIGIVLQLQF